MQTSRPAFPSKAVADVFESYPAPARAGLLLLRATIFEVAQTDARIGALSETLKWGQPSYVPAEPNTGTPLRLGTVKNGDFALFAHCQTSVISEFRALFERDFSYDGNRALLFARPEDVEVAKVTLLIQRALTYRL